MIDFIAYLVIAVFLGLVCLTGVRVSMYKRRADMRKVTLSWSEAIRMLFRKTLSLEIIDMMASAQQHDIQVTFKEMEAHVLASGNVGSVLKTVLASRRLGHELTFSEAAFLDITGLDLVDYLNRLKNSK